MAFTDKDQSKIRQYLLGQLNEAEQGKIEERLMVEDNLFDELEISKSELVEEYRAGELGEKDRREFELRFLATPEGRQAHIFAAALGCLNPPVTAVRKPSFIDRIRDLVGQRPWALVATTASAVVLALVLINPFAPDRPQSSISIALSSSVRTRSTDSTGDQRIAVTSDVGEVKASLKLPEPTAPQAKYRAVLDDREKTTDVDVVGQDNENVSVVIPAELLPPGRYALKLYWTGPDETENLVPGEYVFQVTN